jgi:hypothetical protein
MRSVSFIRQSLIGCLLFATFSSVDAADWVVIEPESHHLRTTPEVEWSRFDQQSEGGLFRTSFTLDGAPTSGTLLIRQADVRLTWKVIVNGSDVGRLQRDENDLLHALTVPADRMRSGENELIIEGVDQMADDVLVGPIRWSPMSQSELFREGTVDVRLVDANGGAPIPGRLTIVDSDGSLVPVGASSDETLAVRTGVVYTSSGRATFGLAAGTYQIFAGRGFEYGRATARVSLQPQQTHSLTLSIGRQVDTAGWVACDPHVHTVTHSGHGDATVSERMITLAGEGIELPIATDHNKQINYEPDARSQSVRQYFTPVIGNEVTTDFGHFNAFPFVEESPTPNHNETDWSVLIPAIFASPDVKVVILNHARDVHRGYRPFGPEHFNEASGESLGNRSFLFNAMETLNSGAQQTDPLELFRDWMTLTNRGFNIAPIGSSDSHDVNRYIVGQGRTYVRVKDDDPGNIDVNAACRSIQDGRVVVSAGLFVEATVDERHGPGDLADAQKPDLNVRYSVGCPDWIEAARVILFQNGVAIRETEIRTAKDRVGTWTIARPQHDVFLTVLALGPGIRHPSWPIAQPYQPDSPEWTPKILSFTGAIRVDADGDGVFSSARDIAERAFKDSAGDFSRLIEALASCDEAVAIQAAALWQSKHGSLLDDSIRSQWMAASRECRAGFARYVRAWRQSEIARVEKP